METRASYVAVGTFVLLLILGLFGFVIWIGKFQGGQEFARYDILFAGSVTGLQVDGTVRYRGIAVGRVLDIRIDPDNIEMIRVSIEVARDTPVKTDTVATLQLAGITGGTYVQLAGGMQESASLPKTTRLPYPVIKSERSGLEELFDAAPDLVAKASNLVDRVTLLFGEENQQAISETLANLRKLSGRFAEGGGNIDSLLSNGAVAVEKIAGMATEFEALAKDLRAQMHATGGEEMPTIADTVASARAAIEQLQKTAGAFELLAADLRTQFTTPGAQDSPSVADLVREGTVALQDIQGMTTQFEQLATDLRTQLTTPGGADSPSVADLVREGTTTLKNIQGMSTEFEQLAADLRGQLTGGAGEGAQLGELITSANAAAANIGSMSAEIEGLAKDLRGEFSGMEGEHGEKISGLLTEASAAARQITTMSAEFEGLAKELRGNVSGLSGKADATLSDLRTAVKDFGKTAKAIGEVADELDATIAENREPLRDFSNSGLYELTQLLTEVRTLVASMTRVSSQIERDPARFFLGDRREGFQAD